MALSEESFLRDGSDYAETGHRFRRPDGPGVWNAGLQNESHHKMNGRGINVRRIITTLILGVLVGFCVSTDARAQEPGSAQEVSPDGTPPNVIFVLVDDMGWGDLGVFFQNQRAGEGTGRRSGPRQRTPHLDRMARQGAMLPVHYAPAPVCAPSRASLLLGQSQGHANVRNNQFDKALENNHTLASVLRNAGYATAAFGKWGLQGRSDVSDYGNRWPANPLDRGFDYFLGYMRHVDGHEHYPKEAPYSDGPKEVWKSRNGATPRMTNITPALDKTYTADLWTAGAKRWITRHEQGPDAEQPFFVYLAYDTPHAVMELPTQDYPAGGGTGGGMQWTGEDGRMINTASGEIDSWVHPDYRGATYDHDGDASTPEVPWPDVYKRYATANRRIDNAMGDLMQLLEDLGINENTLVIFTSDNGPSREDYLPDEEYQRNKPTFFDSYGPFDGIKRDTWEGGVREPTVAYWPGRIPAGTVVDVPSIFYDWLPTLTDAAGVPAPANTDGVSLLPALTGQGAPKRSAADYPVYVEYAQGGTTPEYEAFAPEHQGRERNQMQVIRMDGYVGVRYDIQDHSDDFEIYDVSEDPQQTNDLAESSERPAYFDALQEKMKAKVLRGRRPNASAPRPYDDERVPALSGAAVNEDALADGLAWSAYDGAFPWVPKVDEMDPSASGHAERPALDVRPEQGSDALYFDGYLRAPEDGRYTFSVRANAGAVLRLHEATVIDADHGYVGGRERTGTIKLEAGLHPFRLYYHSGRRGTPMLNVQWSGPSVPRAPIPASAFVRRK